MVTVITSGKRSTVKLFVLSLADKWQIWFVFFWSRWPKAQHFTLTDSYLSHTTSVFSSLLFYNLISSTSQFLVHVGIALLGPRPSPPCLCIWLCFLDADFCLFRSLLWSGVPGCCWEGVPRARPSLSLSRSLSLAFSCSLSLSSSWWAVSGRDD